MAVQALYQCLVTPSLDPEYWSEYVDDDVLLSYVPDSCAERVGLFLEENPELPDIGRLPAYAKRLLEGVGTAQDELDAMLADTSENWSVERMPVVDHAILLLATYEMLNVDEVPVSVCINEAVELAKAFGGEDDSARFVNGVLGRIARTHCADRLGPDEALDQNLGEV